MHTGNQRAAIRAAILSPHGAGAFSFKPASPVLHPGPSFWALPLPPACTQLHCQRATMEPGKASMYLGAIPSWGSG